jgi:serine phosphatase RsbU (regulator of sigma subunit)
MLLVLFLLIALVVPANASANGSARVLSGAGTSTSAAAFPLAADSLHTDSEKWLVLGNQWLFRAGDDSSCTNTKAWIPLDPWLGRQIVDSLGQRKLWTGIGWFRLTIEIDTSLVGKVIGLEIRHQGASEVFVDGTLLFRTGVVSANEEGEERLSVRIPRSLAFAQAGKHEILVRYSNHHADRAWDYSREQNAGFTIFIAEAESMVRFRLQRMKNSSQQSRLVAGIMLTVGLLHFLLYFFYRPLNLNLYYALAVSVFALLHFCSFAHWLAESPDLALWQWRLSNALIMPLFLCLLAFTYRVAQQRFSQRFWWLCGLGFIVFLCDLVLPSSQRLGSTSISILEVGGVGFIILASLEMVVTIVQRSFQRDRQHYPGVIIISIGGLVSLFTFLIGLFASAVPLIAAAGTWFRSAIGLDPITAAFMVFLLSVSVFLAYNVAQTNVMLSRRVVEIETLSARTLEQERLAAERETERLLLEADNTRKTFELEEARKLQLSLLPRSLPQSGIFEIAAAMHTATEVGGDYYDAAVLPDGSVILALGDATGHGAKAGYFVATAKSYFQSQMQSDIPTLPELAGRISAGLAMMNLRGMFMAMTLIRLRVVSQASQISQVSQVSQSEPHSTLDANATLTASATASVLTASVLTAGMPPVLVVRSNGTVETFGQKAMPLASPLSALRATPYAEHVVELHTGDLLLAMSDGFPERFNAAQEIFGYDHTLTFATTLAGADADDVLAKFLDKSRAWAGTEPLNDDMTFVVLRVK